MEKVVDKQVTSGPETKTIAAELEVGSEVGSSVRRIDCFQTDTSDFGELLDNSGAEPVKEQPVLIPAVFGITVGEESQQSPVPELTGGVPVLTTPSPSGPISASARTLIRKYVTENTPSILPSGHVTVAFNEEQVQTILPAVSDETVITSLNLMKNILGEVMRIGARFRDGRPGPSRQRLHCFRGRSASTAGDGSQSEDGAGGYTSSAFSADDDFASFDLQEHRPSTSAVTYMRDDKEPREPVSPLTNSVPSPGFVAADYEPLATLCSQSLFSPVGVCPPPRKGGKHQPESGRS